MGRLDSRTPYWPVYHAPDMAHQPNRSLVTSRGPLMKRLLTLSFALLLPAVVSPTSAPAQQRETYDYWQFNREMIRRGQQAIFTCNGLFTSNRTLEQVFDQELAFLSEPIGTPEGGDYLIDWDRKAVAIGAEGTCPPCGPPSGRESVASSWRRTRPSRTIDGLPILEMAAAAGGPGDDTLAGWRSRRERATSAGGGRGALAAASDWAFDRESPQQVTLSLLVVHDGKIIHERYAPGVDQSPREPAPGPRRKAWR